MDTHIQECLNNVDKIKAMLKTINKLEAVTENLEFTAAVEDIEECES